MSHLVKFNKWYFISAVLLFVVEILIAVFVHDRFIRPYVGDVLVVILIYCFIKAFVDAPVLLTALFVLLFSFLIEGLQFLNIVHRLGLEHSAIATTVMGNSFAWIDILAYMIGIALVLLVEKRMLPNNSKKGPQAVL
jgi:hypothetical protein